MSHQSKKGFVELKGLYFKLLSDPLQYLAPRR